MKGKFAEAVGPTFMRRCKRFFTKYLGGFNVLINGNIAIKSVLIIASFKKIVQNNLDTYIDRFESLANKGLFKLSATYS